MSISLKSFKNFTIASAIALGGLVACAPKQPDLRETEKPYMSKKSIELLDTFTKEKKEEALSDTNYVKFATDTVAVPAYLETQMDKFERNLQQSIKENMPKTLVDSTNVRTYYPSMKQYLEHTKYTYSDDYKDVVPVIDNSKFYTRTSTDTYVPVEYYGIPTSK